jgi:phosphatidylinositol alpha-mannosyltransferase
MKNMKIGLICPYNVSRGGGVKEVVYALQDELRRRGHDVKVITFRPRDFDTSEVGRKDMIYLGTGTDFNSPTHTTIQVSASLNEEIRDMLRKEKFDVLNFHEPWIPFLSRQILINSKSANVATFHATLPDTAISRTVMKVVTPYTKSILKYLHAYTAVSETASAYVSELSGRPVQIIANSIDLDVYTDAGKRDDTKDAKTIFYIGRLENRKGVRYLLDAFALLHASRPDTKLIIAGDGPDRDKLEEQKHMLELDDSVTFVGFISDEEKVEYLHTSDLFCAPALFGESFGLVLLEAMATGLVTVAGNNPGYATVMKGLGAISLVNPKDNAEFSRRLELLLYENDLRKIWRSWAKDEVKNYSYKKIAQQYEESYRKALIQHAKPRPQFLQRMRQHVRTKISKVGV